MANTTTLASTENWNNANAYEDYVGRWSRIISEEFASWLNLPHELRWLEIGCGTGALTKAILHQNQPAHYLAIDRSEDYIAAARENIKDERIVFQVSNINAPNLPDGFDAITSGLVLNFLPDAEKSLSSLMPLLKEGGQMSAFIWDYAGHYQPMRYFWEAAKQTTPKAEKFDPGTKYSICKNTALIDLFRSAGLSKIEFTVIEKIATFKNFDDYWNPLLAAQGSLTELLSLLDEKEKNYLKGVLRHKLPIALNGEIKLIISALCVKGMKAE